MQIILVDSPEKGIEKAKELLYSKVDNKTSLFLSGGKTPQSLYTILAKEQIIKPAAVALVDERFVEEEKRNTEEDNSNEKMIEETGLLGYISKKDIPFYPMITKKSLEESATSYDEKVRDLFFHIPKSVGILGIGEDGHIASIIPNREKFINPLFESIGKHVFVSSIDDVEGKYKKRITLTFSGLSLLDFIVILVFGKEKKNAVKKMFENGPISEIPARFLNTSEVSQKTILITDQSI